MVISHVVISRMVISRMVISFTCGNITCSCSNFTCESHVLFFFVSRGKFSFKVSVYMLELYNDRLIDLLAENSAADVSFKYSSDLNSVYRIYYFSTTYTTS
jgi:hypothetical protein